MSHGNSKYSCEKLNLWLTPPTQCDSHIPHFDEQQFCPLSLKGEISTLSFPTNLWKRSKSLPYRWFLAIISFLPPMFPLPAHVISGLSLSYSLRLDGCHISVFHVAAEPCFSYSHLNLFPCMKPFYSPHCLEGLLTEVSVPSCPPSLEPNALILSLWCFPSMSGHFTSRVFTHMVTPCAVSCPYPHDDPLLLTIATSSAHVQDLVVGWVQLGSSLHSLSTNDSGQLDSSQPLVSACGARLCAFWEYEEEWDSVLVLKIHQANN